jgi:PAS domain S-box-containing protein
VALLGAAGRPVAQVEAHSTAALTSLWPDSSVTFMFVDEQGQTLVAHQASTGIGAESVAGVRVPLGRGITGWVARERQPLRVGDVALDPRYIGLVSGARSEMAAPLVVGERVIGVVNVESQQLDAFSGDDLRLLATLAGQLATIFEKARLDAALAEHAAQLELRVQERTAEIRQQQARTQAILDAVGEGVVVTDLTGDVLYVNADAEKLTGYSAAESIGQNPRLWQSGQTPLETYQAMWQAILAGETWRGEIVNRNKRGELYEALLTIAPIRGAQGSRDLAGFVGVQRDISERKRAERDTLRALAKERELGELKSNFVSLTSHEFRTPLTTILSSAEMLEHYGPRWPEDRKREHLRRIQAAVKYMTSLLEDILVIGKAEANKLEFKPAPLDLPKLLRELVDGLQLADGGRHELVFSSQGECAQAAMDESLLRHIVNNLLSNAIKYSPPNSVVRLDLSCQAGRAVLRVQDAGIGIPPEDQGRLFETFHRASNARNIPGTGLGLSIVKRSVDLHGGEIAVESQVGVGTTVTVTLPLGARAQDRTLEPCEGDDR